MSLSQQHNHLEYLFAFVTWNSPSTSLLPHALLRSSRRGFQEPHLAGVGASQSPVVHGEALTLNSSPIAAVPKYVLYSKESLLL